MSDIHAQLAAIAAQAPKEPTIRASLDYPLAEIDFSTCQCAAETDHFEMAGVQFTDTYYDIDLSNAKWMGCSVEIAECDEDAAINELKKQRGIY